MIKQYKNILLIIYIMTLFAACIGATLAYFTAIKTSTVSPSTKVQTATMSSASFVSGKEIYIYASPDNFGIGMGDLKDSSSAVASLKASDNGDEAVNAYNVILNIKENSFVYSSLDSNPEILIKIIGPDNNEITSITGLTYVEGKGFDITNKVGEFNVVSNYQIRTSTFVEQYWNFEVTLVNLEITQDINMGHSLSGILTLEPVL